MKKPPKGRLIVLRLKNYFLAAGFATTSLAAFGAHVPPLWCLPVPPVMVSPFGQAIAEVAKPNATIKIKADNFFMCNSFPK